MIDLSTPEKVEQWLAEGHWMWIFKVHHGIVELELSCDGVTDLCRCYETCYDHDCGFDLNETGEREEVRHGVRHEWAEDVDGGGSWTVPSDKCITALPIASDTVDRILTEGLDPGIYAVKVDFVVKSDRDFVEAWWV